MPSNADRIPSLDNQFQTLLRRLADAGAEFLVIGGRAEQVMGGARVTYDSDFCVLRTLDNLKRVATALKDLHPRPRDFPQDLPFVFDERTLALGTTFTFETDVGKVDLLGEVEPIGSYDDLLKNAEPFDFVVSKTSSASRSLSTGARTRLRSTSYTRFGSFAKPSG